MLLLDHASPGLCRFRRCGFHSLPARAFFQHFACRVNSSVPMAVNNGGSNQAPSLTEEATSRQVSSVLSCQATKGL